MQPTNQRIVCLCAMCMPSNAANAPLVLGSFRSAFMVYIIFNRFIWSTLTVQIVTLFVNFLFFYFFQFLLNEFLSQLMFYWNGARNWFDTLRCRGSIPHFQRRIITFRFWLNVLQEFDIYYCAIMQFIAFSFHNIQWYIVHSEKYIHE